MTRVMLRPLRDTLRRARVRSIGLSTALGDGIQANKDGLRRGEPLLDHVTLTSLSEPVQVPYLSVGTPDVDADKFFRPMDFAVREALSAADLTHGELCNMPLFIGSTSYAVRLAEACFDHDLAAGDKNAVPLPFAGFDQASEYLREEFGLLGSEYLINTACASSANAALAAAAAIAAGRVEHALVVGLELFNVTTLAGFFGMQLLTNDVMRPFDKRRDGLILGEGCGVVLLSASDGGDTGLYVSAGASACDTYSITASNPDGSSIAQVMSAALQKAALAPEEIRAIKAHGTASPLNDDGEAAGMHRVFATIPPVFALKPYVGHTLGGCGAIELAMFVAAYEDGFVPLSAGFECRDERLAVEPLTETISADHGSYMLNFFGFGGNNSTLIMTAR